MNNLLLSKIFSKLIIAIVIIALADLIYLNWWVVKNGNLSFENQGSTEVRVVGTVPSPLPSPISSPSESAKEEVDEEVKVVEIETIVEKETQTIVQTAQKEIFIPVGTGSTKSNSYTDLPGLEVTIDTNKYSAIESVVFEGSIWVQDGNGKVFAQLYNKTDKHPVWNSEISTSSAVGVLSTSSQINLDNGNKTYQVQAKTNLTSFAAHVDNARIKITLK